MSIEIRPFQMADTEATVSLWQETGPTELRRCCAP